MSQTAAVTDTNTPPPSAMSRTAPTLSTLPLDVRDRILTSSPTRATLLSLIRSSKEAFYVPFSQRRTSIVLTVVQNEVGPAFKHAKAVKRAVQDLGSPTIVAHKRIPAYVNDPSSLYWEDEFYEIEFDNLVAVGRTGEAAEREYSIRHKNRLSNHSQLSSEESRRFREAFYKCWLVYCLFDSDSMRPTDGQESSDSFNSKLKFLADSTPEDIVAMYEASNFLEDVARHTLEYKDIRLEGQGGNSSLTTMGSANINIPPDEILRCFVSQTSTFPPRIMHPTRDRTLRAAWVDFIGGGIPKLDGHRIVNDVQDFVDECTRCRQKSPWLYHRHNWDRMSETIRPEFLFPLIPASTAPQHFVKRVLRSFVSSRGFDSTGRVLYSKMLQDLLRHQAETGGWDGTTWVCGICMKKIIQAHLGSWITRTQEGLAYS